MPHTTENPPHHGTFDADDWHILARHWYPIVRSVDLATSPHTARLLDQPLVVYRADDEIVVADDLCPHRGVPLSAGTGDGASVACAYHGIRFGRAGTCIQVPAHPRTKIPRRLHLTTYPVVERYGLVWTCLRPSDEQVPKMPHWNDSAFQRLTCPAFDIAAFAGRQLEGFLDVAHFPFVHRDTFGDAHDTTVPDYQPVSTPHGFTVDYWSTHTNYSHADPRTPPPGYLWLRTFDVHLPFTATLVVHFPHEGKLSIMNAASPVSARQTRLFAPIAKNFDTDQPEAEVQEFNRRIFEEDRAVVELQQPENLPLDPRIEVNIAADRSSVAYRRELRRLGLSQFFTA